MPSIAPTRIDAKGDLSPVDALVLAPAKERENWYLRLPVLFVLTVIVAFPLFYGGKEQTALFVVKAFIFIFTAVLASRSLVVKTKFLTLDYPPYALLLALFSSLVALLLLQLVPLPLSVLGSLSPAAAAKYQAAGAETGFLSLEPARTAAGISWFAALGFVFFYLIMVPGRVASTSVSGNGKRSAEKNDLVRRARDTDSLVEKLQSALIFSALLAAVIAIAHWALRSELLFGVFDPQRGGLNNLRAHWPFVNPDHLVVLLEMGALAACARILRLSQIRALRNSETASDNLALRILQSPGRLGRRVPYALALLTMVLAGVLTLSRAGNVLVIIGLIALWLVHSRLRERLHELKRGRSSKKSKTSEIERLVFPKIKAAAVILGVAFVVLFFLGQTGRDLAATRIEYGLAAGYDESRADLADTTIKVFKSYVVFGTGLGCWSLAAAEVIPRKLAGWTLDFAHSDYLQFLAEAGIAGAVILFAAGLVILLSCYRVWKMPLLGAERVQLTGALLVVLLPLLHAFVDFPFHIPALAFCFAASLAVLLRIVRMLREKNDF